MTVLEGFLNRDIRALSRIISFVENREDGYRDLLGKLYEKVGQSTRIGITGPPGAGKSTVVNSLIHQFLSIGKTVGVIAIDPSSPFTGGALLGDRVRMNEFPTGGTVYFRSMATRGATGGLAQSTENTAVVLDAFGFDVILIETVGVGQVELDVIDACDTVAVVLVPESGDAVQTMKAGLMEIADIMVVNKSDRPGAERIAADLRTMLLMRKKEEGLWKVPVISTIAVNNENIDKLFKAIEDHVEFHKASGAFESHRREQIKKKILSILKTRFQREFVEHLAENVEFSKIVDEIFSGENNPYRVSEELYESFSDR
ncbi:MAG: methylmalonyl Co-A mutase-associated GTPase MeaB [candidate division Zixibacteria bacterium]|nr:methylmalonyl Co-A mutase-associated GTPase MeaB [candidate division Zixibacteria bacterium]